MLKIKKIKPMFTALVTSMERYNADKYTTGGIIDPTKTKTGLKEYQKVIAIGGSVREIKVGDLVCINPSRFAIKEHKENTLQDGIISDNMTTKYNFDVVSINGIECLLLQDRDIEFIVEEWSEEPDPEIKAHIIIPPKQKIIN